MGYRVFSSLVGEEKPKPERVSFGLTIGQEQNQIHTPLRFGRHDD
jgi:hypothetical protein